MTNTNPIALRTIAFLLALIFASFLYLQMATVSIYENYEADIGRIRIFSPELIVLCILVLIAIIPGRIGMAITTMAVQFSKVATWVCVVFAGLYVVLSVLPSSTSHWSFPSERTLSKTLAISLSHPDFSNRSLARLILSALLVLFLGWLSRKLLSKRHNNSLQPTSALTRRRG
jgi:lysylphosphatidylglycerol synthetase-like protein (DUF2156 family)